MLDCQGALDIHNYSSLCRPNLSIPVACFTRRSESSELGLSVVFQARRALPGSSLRILDERVGFGVSAERIRRNPE